jgi:pimeloyl-ACP methyl ester carboxylesterase
MTSFVLCHGGGMGGWVWRYLTPFLRAQGHDVYTPTYTGFGERSHLIGRNIHAATHAQDIANVLRFEDIEDCVLVGHSYSGVVLPAIKQAEPGRIKRVVMVDALLTYTGEAPAAAMGFMPAEQAAGLADMLASGEGPIGSGVDAQQREQVKTEPHLMSAERQDWLLAHLSDMPLACIVTPAPAGAETLGTDVDYLAVTQTIMKPMHARARALGWRVQEFEGDHAIIVGDPEPVANFLLSLA